MYDWVWMYASYDDLIYMMVLYVTSCGLGQRFIMCVDYKEIYPVLNIPESPSNWTAPF